MTPPRHPPRLAPPPDALAGRRAAGLAAGLTAWRSFPRRRAVAPPPPRRRRRDSDLHYNFLGYADLEQGVTPLYPLQPGRVVKVSPRRRRREADAPLFTLDPAGRHGPDAERPGRPERRQCSWRTAAQGPAQETGAQHQAQIDGQQAVIDARKQEAAAAQAKADKARRAEQRPCACRQRRDRAAADEQAKAAAAAVEGERRSCVC